MLAGILDTAVRDGRIARNVARGAQNLPAKRSEKPRRYLTHAEVVRLAEAASTETYRTLILVFAYCGLRSEAIGMHVRDINFGRHRAQEPCGREVNGKSSSERRSRPTPRFVSLRSLNDRGAFARSTTEAAPPNEKGPGTAQIHGSRALFA